MYRLELRPELRMRTRLIRRVEVRVRLWVWVWVTVSLRLRLNLRNGRRVKVMVM